jgi:hypothetical protein
MLPTRDEMLAAARVSWGPENLARSKGDKIRFGTNGSKELDLSKLVWRDYETGDKGGYVKLFKLARVPLSNGGSATNGTTHDASETQRRAEQRERSQELALGLWGGSVPAAGTLAERYLTARRLAGLAASLALRFRRDCPHPARGRLPAMVALVTDVAEQPLGIHRTFLRRDGSAKADAEPQRASLGPIWGGAVRLDPLAPELVIGEGIETSAAAGRLLSLPAWAAISAGNLGRGLLLPPEVRAVVIATDRDLPGERAASEAWHRWCAEGRRVRLLWPQVAGADCNDVLMAQEAAS